ncbi:AIPR family protein, partial [Enterobacter hormaechei]
MIAKVIIFKQVQSLVRPLLPAFQGNVAIYLVALLSQQHGSRIDLMRVWEQQGLSDGFKDQIRTWAKEVNVALHASAKGKMISEWAKK